MFKSMKLKLADNKKKRLDKEERKKIREEKEWEIIKYETTNYLNNCLPTLVLAPEIANALVTLLKLRGKGGQQTVHLTDNYYEVMIDYFHEELIIFVLLLEKKGISLIGKEDMFFKIFIDEIREKNYKECKYVYGDFVDENTEVKDAIYTFFDNFGIDIALNSDVVDFLNIYLFEKKIILNKMTNTEFTDLIVEMLESYKFDSKVRLMEQRTPYDY